MFVPCYIFQAAFLSALAGVESAGAAAQAAVTTLSEVDDNTASKGGRGSFARNTRRGWFYTYFKHLGMYLLSWIHPKIGSNTWDLLEVSPYLISYYE